MRKCVWGAVVRPGVIVCVCALGLVPAAAAQSVPSPWAARDVGSPALAGFTSHVSGVFRMDGAGGSTSAASDQLHFLYQQVSGDVEIVARVEGLDPQDTWSRVGVMIRGSLAANAAYGWTALTATRGVHFFRRAAGGGPAAVTAGPREAAPLWVRAVRRGGRVTTSWSRTGTSWSNIGTEAIALAGSAYVGIALTSQNPSARATAYVSNVRVTRLGLPSGQRSMDIGAPAIKGSATYVSGSYRITAGGTDIWGRADQFHFVYQPLTGDGEIVARVASLTYADRWTKAGVMIRESLTAGSRHAMLVVTPGRGDAFQRRHETGEYSTSTPGGGGTAPGWVRLVRKGHRVDAYRSSNGTTWALVGSDTVPMEPTVYVGLAVTSHNERVAAQAAVDGFRLVASTVTANQPPAVSITAPATGSLLGLSNAVTISAVATDPENRMLSVDFYAGSTRVARDTTAPYAVAWLPAAAGSYQLTAIAYDADGNSTTSSAVSVSVGTATAATTTVPRVVSFTASADHATNVSSYVLEIFASGANPSTATPVAVSDLGKPTPSSAGTIAVDRAAFFNALQPGSYLSTVSAVGPGGRTRSSPVTFTR